MPEDCLNTGHHSLLNYSETPPTGISAELRKWKNANIWFMFIQDHFNLLLENYLTIFFKFLDIAHTNIPYVQLKFVQMVAPPTLSTK